MNREDIMGGRISTLGGKIGIQVFAAQFVKVNRILVQVFPTQHVEVNSLIGAL